MKALFVWLMLCSLITLGGATVQAQAAPERIVRVQRVGQYHEVEVTSSSDFPVGALPLTLWVGDKACSRYAHARGGDLKVAVFYLTPAEFSALKSGDAARITYGQSQASSRAWSLGAFNKDLGVVR